MGGEEDGPTKAAKLGDHSFRLAEDIPNCVGRVLLRAEEKIQQSETLRAPSPSKLFDSKAGERGIGGKAPHLKRHKQ